jgi:hypothetical protein
MQVTPPDPGARADRPSRARGDRAASAVADTLLSSPPADQETTVTEAPASTEPIAGALVALLERCAEEVAAERTGAVARELVMAGAAPDPGADYRGWSSV